MQLAHLVITFIFGILLSIIWSSKNWLNALIKVGLIVWTFWTACLLMAVVLQANPAMRFF